ncbi:MAG TPA: cyclopropane-fatty-acyl-phospholipid synthase family protein [Casimicrobiaceae bacterium]|nr:cyclopropane-fatty-acyl-phospholipid synthase family protein [Casimicrobiaceae bacterium]
MNDGSRDLATTAAAPASAGKASMFPAGTSALRAVFEALGRKTSINFRVQFVDGSIYQSRSGTPQLSIRFNRPGAQWQVLTFGHIGLLESYFDGGIDIEGDFALAFRAAFEGRFESRTNPLVKIRNRWHEFRFGNGSIARAKANARFHYGLGEAFYRYWLDPAMMYTCAYWKEGTRDVAEAQRNKMDHVCRKVLLKPGETFVDVGCGWGGLMFHAWDHYGALGTGINTTTEQVHELEALVAARGLSDKLKVIDCDFREIPGQYDKLLSIGTLEHAGRDQMLEVIKAHADCLKPGGLGVIHFIGHVGMRDTEFYIRKHIFPGGWIPSLAEAITWMEHYGLEVMDVENLRRHYAHTLDAWAGAFEANWDKIHALDPKRFDERFRRTWRTYLFSCAEMFRAHNAQTCLFQVLVSKGNVARDKYPMSRAHLYQ